MQAEQPSERERFEVDAGPYGFDLTRDNNVTGEPWCDYKDPETGHRWAGWLARKEPHQVPAGDGQRFEAWADSRKGASLRHSMSGSFDYPLGRFMREAFEAGAALSQPTQELMVNGLTEAETSATASVFGLSQPTPQVGWKLVPVEPTVEMKFAMAECDGWRRGDRDHPGLTRWEDYWRVAIAASPTNATPISEADILGAVARGWCTPANSSKEMDADLALAIATEVHAMLDAAPLPVQKEKHV